MSEAYRPEDAAVFTAIAAAGGLAAAEAATGLPRSSLSRKLTALERRLGVQLAKRSPQAFSLTPSGEDLFRRYAAALDQIREAEAEVMGDKLRARGLVRLTTPSPIAHGLLLCELPAFLRANHDVWVVIDIDRTKVDLRTQPFDLAFRVGDVVDDGLIARRFFEECEALYASPDWCTNNAPLRTPDDLRRQPAILCAPRAPDARDHPLTLVHGSATATAELRIAVCVNDPVAGRLAAEQGLGIANLPRFIGDPACAEGRLVRLLPDWTSPVVTIRAILPHSPTLAARNLLDHLLKAAKRRWG